VNRGPELLGAPESAGPKHFTLPRPGSRPSRSKAPPPLSALRASSFSPWGPAKGIDGPQVTVEPGPLRALLRHCQHHRQRHGTLNLGGTPTCRLHHPLDLHKTNEKKLGGNFLARCSHTATCKWFLPLVGLCRRDYYYSFTVVLYDCAALFCINY